MLGDCHTHSGSGCIAHTGMILPGKCLEDIALKFFGHTNAIILNIQDVSAIFISLRRRFLIQIDLNPASLLGEFNCVANDVQKDLAQTDTVCAYIFMIDIVCINMKLYIFFLNLRLNDNCDILYDLTDRKSVV